MRNKFISAVTLATEKEILKRLVFSKPTDTEIKKVSARLCAHRGRKFLAFEYSLPGDTVSHKNIEPEAISAHLTELFSQYGQANLITTLGDCEWKINKRGEITLGCEALSRRAAGDAPDFECAIEALDKKKNYILRGDEPFLIALGVSDKSGRVHDKKQGKFRQINRFLEHIEDVFPKLSGKDDLTVYDLCCGKSYLSFAAYYYLTEIKKKRVYLLGVDLKRDVISWCDSLARSLGFSGMRFVCQDISELPTNDRVDMVISLHACDIATDIVINAAARLGAEVILSTPCCHRYLNGKVAASELRFVTDYPQLSGKLCEAITDAIRLARLKSFGYDASAKELTDPENTPKNTLLVAIKREYSEKELSARKAEYERILDFVLGDKKNEYLKNL